ncbi:MAG TPA: preprotein translocase subunit SecG [Pyrinomonadaceae bacterium]
MRTKAVLVYFLYGLFILTCIVLIVAVLLQPGKADAGALFTSSVSSTAFGPRGTQTLLAKITIGAAILFMLTALMLSLPRLTGSRSVLQSTEAEPTPAPAATPQPTPAAPAASPATGATTAPATSSAPAGTNTNK